MIAEEGVRLERVGGIGRIVLCRPAVGNAINLKLAQAFAAAAEQCDLDPQIRCVVLTGEGRLFCVGGDLNAFAAAGSRADALIRAITASLHLGIARLLRMEKPLVTLINGPAGGAGLSLACLGDIAIAAESAHFTAGYTAIGLTPDGALTWTLPRLVGLRRALDLIFTNRRVSSAEALEIGLVTRSVPDDALEAEGTALARQLAAASTLALAGARNLLRNGIAAGVETQMELEARLIARLAVSADGREGLAAFLAKRPPRFG